MGAAMRIALKSVRGVIIMLFFAAVITKLLAIPPFAAILIGLVLSMALDHAIEVLEGIR